MTIFGIELWKSKKDIKIEKLIKMLNEGLDEKLALKRELSKLEADNEKLNQDNESFFNAVSALETQRDNLQRQLEEKPLHQDKTQTQKFGAAAFIVPEEGFEHEAYDHILIALKNYHKTLSGDCRNERHKKIIAEILDKNAPSGQLTCHAKTARNIIAKSPQKLDKAFFKQLERFGISLVDNKNHWKIEYMGMTTPIAKTPSDFHSRPHNAAAIVHKFFY